MPHVASGERYAAPHVARGDQRAARLAVAHPVSYQALLERLVLHRLVLERLVMAVPEPQPQHLTLLARWSAGPRRRLVREVKTRLDARSVFHSCWRPPKWTLLTTRQLSEAATSLGNVGIFEIKDAFEIPDDDWQRMFETNVLSGVRLTRHYGPRMRESPELNSPP